MKMGFLMLIACYNWGVRLLEERHKRQLQKEKTGKRSTTQVEQTSATPVDEALGRKANVALVVNKLKRSKVVV